MAISLNIAKANQATMGQTRPAPPPKSGQRTVGYDAKLLPMVCEVYLCLRDDALAKTGKLPRQYEHIIHKCDALMRGLATVGITRPPTRAALAPPQRPPAD